MAVESGIESVQVVRPVDVPQQRAKSEEFLRIPRLRNGSRAEFIWIATEVVRGEIEIVSEDKDGAEFSFTVIGFRAEDVLKSAVGTITKALPTAKQRKRVVEHPDTLHFTPDAEEYVTEDGSIQLRQPAAMVIPRRNLDDYIITRYQKQGSLSTPALPLLEVPTL